jgi:hypothetical protein
MLACKFCFSHYVAIRWLIVTRYKLLYDDWRGYIVDGFALVWIANIYMGIFARVRLDIHRERAEISSEQEHLEQKKIQTERERHGTVATGR